MKKVLVIGCCGAGKSTFSKTLQSILKLELIQLDQYYHKPNWEESEKEQWEGIVNNLVQKPSWIMDGNYKGTFDIRFKEADTIIYLDYSTLKCLWRVIKRIVKYNGTVRLDMPNGCEERFDWHFIHYVATFNSKNRKGTLERLNAVKKHKKDYIFKTGKEADLFLSQIT